MPSHGEKEALPHSQRDMAKYLTERGFQAIRSAKHGIIWGDRYGNTILVAGTPGDRRSWMNTVADIRRCIAMRPAPEGAPPEKPKAPPQIEVKDPKWIDVKKEATPLKSTFAEIMKRPQVEERAPRRVVLTPPPQAPKAPAAPGLLPMRVSKLTRAYYTQEQREKVWARIKELRFQGKKSTEIAETLTEEGFERSDGSPILPNYVSQVLSMNGWATAARTLEKEVPQVRIVPQPAPVVPLPVPAVPSTPPPPPAAAHPAEVFLESMKETVAQRLLAPEPLLPAACTAILTDPRLPDSKKAHMLANYARVAKAKCPEIVSSLISDPQLTDEEKVAMLMGYVEI